MRISRPSSRPLSVLSVLLAPVRLPLCHLLYLLKALLVVAIISEFVGNVLQHHGPVEVGAVGYLNQFLVFCEQLSTSEESVLGFLDCRCCTWAADSIVPFQPRVRHRLFGFGFVLLLVAFLLRQTSLGSLALSSQSKWLLVPGCR